MRVHALWSVHKTLNDKGEITSLREPLKMTEIYANDLET